ncbi:MAG: hypothetical protein HYW62_04250 [Candidatus Levybacteria bacterium]|nr:hypothetical protein [Candidatus Levybacteria bacterium]
MKEILNQKLANLAQTPYSKGGDIFMAEPGHNETGSEKLVENQTPQKGEQIKKSLENVARIGEQEKETRKQQPLTKEERVLRAREAWEHYYGEKWQSLSPEERQEAEGNIKEDLPPIAGGADPLSVVAFLTDPTLLNIVREVNQEVGRIGAGNPLDMDFVTEQLRRVQNLQDQGRIDRGLGLRLIGELQGFAAESAQARARQDRAQTVAFREIHDISQRSISHEQKERLIVEQLRTLSPAEPFQTELIDSIVDYDKALEYLVNRIISEPLDAETSRYQLSFYGGINFSLIRERMKVRYEGLAREAEDPQRTPQHDELLENSRKKEGLFHIFEYMRTGAELTHNMNAKVVTGDIEQFIGVARELEIMHLQVLQRSELVSTVVRLYEQELKRVIARDGKITTKNYEEVTGTILDEKGSPFDERGRPIGKKPGSVEKRLYRLNKERPAEDRLEEWQLKWAFHSGRNILNITLRAAELIAQSKEIGYRSYPQESASRIIDPLNLTGQRFGIAEQRGGLHLYEMTEGIFNRDRGNFGWLKSNIKTLMGGDRRQFELRGIFEITGVWSGWRQNNIIQIQDPDNTGRTISLEEFTKEKGGQMSSPAGLRTVFLENGELKENFVHSLGVVLRLGAIMPSEKDKEPMLAAKREVRAAIWRRVARDNPLAMVDFLRGMRFEDGKEPLPNINVRLEQLDNIMFTTATRFEDKKIWAGGKTNKNVLSGEYKEAEVWDSLREKLVLAHEKRMANIKTGNFAQLIDVFEVNALSVEERDIFNRIRDLGLGVARDMAEIRFPSDPFMNDVLFEAVNYGEAGAEFFRRRLGGDIPSMYKAGGSFTNLMDNPGGIPNDKAQEVLHEMERALESPQGQEAGQNNIAAPFEAYLQFVRAGGNVENVPELINFLINENSFVNSIRKIRKAPNSWAQFFAGPEAPAFDAFQIGSQLDRALLAGTIRRGKGKGEAVWTDLYERFRKKFKTSPLWLLLRFLIDATPIFLIGGAFDMGQKTVKEEK